MNVPIIQSSHISGHYDIRTGRMVADKYGRPVTRLLDPETGMVSVVTIEGIEIAIELPLVEGGQGRADDEVEGRIRIWLGLLLMLGAFVAIAAVLAYSQ
jgi:hypothetical protein